MWDSLLDKIRDWMIVRFALNTDRDLWGWLFVIGAAAHLEHLAFIVLWIADQRPVPFEKYRPKRINSLGQAVDTIQTRGLLDPTTVETLTRVNRLRNSVAHRGAIYGVTFRESHPSMGEYKGQHVFTNPDGMQQLMDDLDTATSVIVEWLRERGLNTN